MSDVRPPPSPIAMLPASWFMAGCTLIACGILLIGRVAALPLWLLASEVLATVLGLFLLGSFRYQIHKNALTFGMSLVTVATFIGLATSGWHAEVANRGAWYWASEHVLSFRGLDDLIHADTMLFILGLTFFVPVIAQTRLLEGITFFMLRRNEAR